jgi:Ala-tRNA(Pro) deacylase
MALKGVSIHARCSENLYGGCCFRSGVSQANVGYTVLPHVPAFTAQAEAAVVHVPRRDWAKAVIFFADGQPIQAVVPADLEVDMYRLAALAGATTIRLAGEHELRWLYPDCERGAMPPLGPLYNQPVFVDQTLARENRLAFNAGTHARVVATTFAATAHPTSYRFARRPRD